MEFQTNTKNCFISDDVLAENFGVSKSTISRSMKELENKGFITRDTKNVKGGKERHIAVNIDNIEKTLQQSNCLLTKVNLTIDNRQNDSIKDKIKDNIKDKIELRD